MLKVLLLLLGELSLSVLEARRLLTLLRVLFSVVGLHNWGNVFRLRLFHIGELLGYLVLLDFLFGHLFILTAAALMVRDLLEGVIEDDRLRRGVPVVAAFHSKRWSNTTVIRGIVSFANHFR